MENKEFRSLDNLEVRSIADNPSELVLEGYIAKFDSLTELCPGYFEKIDRHAFDETLADGHNVYLVYSHDISKVLASTRNNTLEVNTDDTGLKFKATINKNLSYASDTYELVSSGEVRGCSFGFYTIKDNVEYDSSKDVIVRTLLNVQLLEGTITPIPAYEDTTVEARAKGYKEEFDKKTKTEDELRELGEELELFLINDEMERG